MNSNATSPDAYLHELPEDRRFVIEQLREVFTKNLPKGFEEEMSYGMIGFVVPYALYPKGYHCKPHPPLPFISIASQKNFVAVYHMGLYAFPQLLDWFIAEYPKHSQHKLDMGKSCIRFKKMNDIPYKLLATLAQKITVQQWIDQYEAEFLKD